MPELQNTTAVVTGSSRGIGRAIALALARHGADIVIHGHQSGDQAEQVAEEVRSIGRSAKVCLCDLQNGPSLEPFINETFQWRSGVDTWVNNAGFDTLTGEAADLSFEDKLENLWRTDVLGTIGCSRLAGARMKDAGGGQIINIGWDQANQGMEGDSGELFAASKGAIMSYSMSCAKSLAPQVRVNCVAPGWIKTKWGEQHASEYWNQRAIAESLRGRWGTPEDVAAAVCFLASPAADFITGQILPVNGGFRSAPVRDTKS